MLSLPRVLACLAVLASGLATTAAPAAVPAEAPVKSARATTVPVWQAAQAPHEENPSNPLANRLWGVYHGPQDQLYYPYEAADPATQAALNTIRLRPRTKWFANHVPDSQIQSKTISYIANSQAGNPEALSQIAVFRMKPWENEACERPPTRAEQASYKTWIRNLASGIGSAPTLIVMQPDGPFLWCTPKPKVSAKLIRFATRTLSNLPATSVYIDAGAADWCKPHTKPTAARCIRNLKRTGVAYARGFAMDSTHYTGPEENILLGSQMVDLLRKQGYGSKHFIIDTAKSGQPTEWTDMIPAAKGEERDNARTCTTPTMTRCVTLGIPPTARPGDPEWGLSEEARRLAAENVDGFVWFGRPWLYYQADPFVMQRALDMVSTTPWPEP
ncbi:hypothetical protein EXE58_17500 [Nocardioides seonyuensis]|uniref:Glucanase n=1 Tax=Nocardioides seonyuensis TaxID=2518371 RepID=A0A4P7ILN1_9ACTN|nr:glycoside hydrolase family 6 protein [Nocardioides seonyuensis]QBX57051.1 hypothetical protein EXE58_17500 [Nocardioides seonyuensis]